VKEAGPSVVLAMSSQPLTTTVNSDEINYLVFRYLQESGYVHSAFTFGYESHVCKSKIDGSQIPPGALLSFVQRGVNFVEIEESIANGGEYGPSSSSALDGTTSLLEVHKCLCSENFKKGKPDRNANSSVLPAVGDNASPRTSPEQAAGAENTAMMEVDTKASGGATAAPQLSNGDDQSKQLQVPNSDVLLLKGHRSEVFVCAWNPRTAVLASGSGDSTARIWPIPSNTQGPLGSATVTVAQPVVLQHSPQASDADASKGGASRKANDVTTMDWNSAGTLLGTGSYDGCARIWTEGGELKHTLSLHKGPLFSLKWNQAGNYLLSGSVDKTTAVWDAATGRCVKHFKVHNAPTLDVDWRDNTSFASCSTDKMIYLCSLEESGPLRAYEGHRDEINCVRFDSSSSLLASCSDDGTAKVWSVSSSALAGNRLVRRYH
jgi:transducin (beta)-like 1